MNFILKNNIDRYLSFGQSELNDVEFILRQLDESDNLAKQFLEIFQTGAIPKEMSDNIAKLVEDGMMSGKLWEVSNRERHEIDGSMEHACDMHMSIKWQVYLALFKDGPISVHQTILNQHLGWVHKEEKKRKEQEVEYLMSRGKKEKTEVVDEEYIPFG